MTAKENDFLILNYWHHSVSIGKKLIRLKHEENTFSYHTVESQNKISGWYAIYDEGIFVFFKSNGKFTIGWNGQLITVCQIDKINWKSSWKKISFDCFSAEKKRILVVEYRNFRRLLFHPLKLIGEILMPDDDWGLESDLPSFIHSSFTHGTLEEDYNKLLEREI